MKKQYVALCMIGILIASLCFPVAAADQGEESFGESAVSKEEKGSLEADTEGTVSFQNLSFRMRKENFAILSLQATLDSQKAFDRKKVYHDLVNGINDLADAAWYLASTGKDSSALQANIDSMHKELESLKEDEYEKTMQKLSIQIEESINQVIIGGETLYLAILSNELNLSDLNENLNTMERRIEATKLRYRLGQNSDLTLQELQLNYHDMESRASALEYEIKNMKASLQVLLGESPSGNIMLKDLPSVSNEQNSIQNINYDTALQKAKEKSLALALAKIALEDAEDTWNDARDDYTYGGYRYKMAEQTYKSAVDTYESTVKSFELSFEKSYEAIPDAEQTVEVAKNALKFQEKNFVVAQLNYQLGQISAHALEENFALVLSAKTAVNAAEINLFKAYHTYEWAVEHGV